ncbi:MAG: helix-turn-helix transcriptional regulator [Verrucomicrobiota bacterium]
MSCRERPPGEHTDHAVASAAATRAFLAVVEQLLAAYRARLKLPVAVLRAHMRKLKALIRSLSRVPSNPATEPACVHHARQFIAAHLIEPLTAEMVAKEVGLCPQQFRKRFKRATGQTFRQYLTLRRIEHAKTLLLNPEHKVITATFAAGFQSVPTFYRAFRSHTGQSPTQYRQSLAQSGPSRVQAGAKR